MNCKICSGVVKSISIKCKCNTCQNKILNGFFCESCRAMNFPENNTNYEGQLSKTYNQKLQKLRNSDKDRPGREFHMVEMGINFIGKKDFYDITFFGAGHNEDHILIEKKYKNSKQKLVDLENYQFSSKFESIKESTQSDVVVACEVIEHFENPIEDFSTIFRIVKDEGIAICSTNINDNDQASIDHNKISKQMYPFVKGHTYYWSGESLVQIANKFGFKVDFRVPEIASKRAGPRKRYVIFYKCPKIQERISIFFSKNMFAPSEKN